MASFHMSMKTSTTAIDQTIRPTIMYVSFSSIYHNKDNAYGNSHLHPNWRLSFGWSAESAMRGHSSKVLLPAFLGAIRALVLLYLIRFRWSHLHALAVEPPLTNVACNPELIWVVDTTATAAEGFTVFFVVPIPIFNSCWSRVLHLSIIWSLQNKVKCQSEISKTAA